MKNLVMDVINKVKEYKKDYLKYLVIDKSKTLFPGIPSDYKELKKLRE